jgi:YidC/Oxa1 family membrane protein insertase
MDSQRLILFFVFSFSVFMLLDAWQRDQQPARPPSAVAAKDEKAMPPSAQPPVPGEKLTASQSAVPKQGRGAPETGVTIRVETDVLSADISSYGGDVRRLEFKNHRDTLDRSKNFVLFETGAAAPISRRPG